MSTRRRESNPIQEENAKTGTTDWQLTNPATAHEIEGYASLTSVNRGEPIDFLVNTVDPTYTIEIFRLGWYGGDGGRRVTDAVQHDGTQQVTPPPDPLTGLVECQWIHPVTQTIPADWTSGFYVAKLKGSGGKESYIVFVVRDDARASAYLFVSAVTTYHAYNDWGGKSLYDFISSDNVKALKVSFDRPYAVSNRALEPDPMPAAAGGVGTGHCFNIACPITETLPAGWEYNMVRFLESEGYDVAYASSIDLHANANLLHGHKAFLSVGHDEYWSADMRAHLATACNQGVGCGFFSSNNIYWQIRLDPNAKGDPNRTIVCYKDTTDPFFHTQPSLTTVQFRQFPVNSPEDAFLGVMYVDDPADEDIVVQDASHWAFAFTGLRNGDHLPGLLGYEVDKFYPSSPEGGIPSSPPNVIPLAHSPYPDPHFEPSREGAPTRYADMTIYDTGKTFVFAAGTMQWAWGLDDFNAPDIRPSVLNDNARQITRNLLDAFVNPPATNAAPVQPIRVNAGGPLFDDASGTTWDADRGFEGGQPYITDSPIANTAAPELYQTQRVGESFSYTFAAPPGIYIVTLKFAELFYTTAGQRQFNVSINGVPVLRDFDVFQQAGGELRALDRVFTVPCKGAENIVIAFTTGTIDLPIVNAISIRQADAETILVNAGGPAYTQLPDTNWDADFGFMHGTTNSTDSPISNTTTPELYQTQRVGNFSYLFMVPAGTYTVTLKFAELEHKAAGQRVFNVLINGVKVLPGFDVVSKAGAPLTAIDETFTVFTPGQITIQFSGSPGHEPIVNAIGIATAGPAPNVVSAVHMNAGGFSYTDASGVMWDDYGATGGIAFGTQAPIKDTDTPFLYRTQRQGDLSYQFAVPAGKYAVTLKFAELSYDKAGMRIFNVSINGVVVLKNFDVLAHVAQNTALDRNFPVDSSGQIVIHFSPVKDAPMVSAIEILSVNA